MHWEMIQQKDKIGIYEDVKSILCIIELLVDETWIELL